MAPGHVFFHVRNIRLGIRFLFSDIMSQWRPDRNHSGYIGLFQAALAAEFSGTGQCELPILEGWGGHMPEKNKSTVCVEGARCVCKKTESRHVTQSRCFLHMQTVEHFVTLGRPRAGGVLQFGFAFLLQCLDTLSFGASASRTAFQSLDRWSHCNHYRSQQRAARASLTVLITSS